MVCLGGRIAESLVLDDISTGASNDIKQATQIAKRMVTRYGMSDKIGIICYENRSNYDDWIADKIVPYIELEYHDRYYSNFLLDSMLRR